MVRLSLPKGLPRGTELSMREGLGPLLGDRRGSMALLALCSVFSGFVEAATLAMIAQLAAAVVGGAVRGGHAGTHNAVLSLINLHLSVGLQILITFGLCLAAAAASDPALDAAGEHHGARDGEAAQRTVRRLQPGLLEHPVTRQGGKPAGDHDQPGHAGDQRRIGNDRAACHFAAVPRADGRRAVLEPGRWCRRWRSDDRAVRAAAADAQARRSLRESALADAGDAMRAAWPRATAWPKRRTCSEAARPSAIASAGRSSRPSTGTSAPRCSSG